MIKFNPRNVRLLLAGLAGLIMVFIALAPQAWLIYSRGSQWNGNYSVYDLDEMAYASYLQSLIDGRNRVNDPFTRLEQTEENPLPESYFSIQFFAPYAVAIPARIAGASAPAAMIATGAVSAFLAAVMLFWLIHWLTGNAYCAFSGTLIVLCLGTIASGQGAIFHFLQYRVPAPFYPALRRYVPALVFPLVVLFWRLVLELLSEEEGSTRKHIVNLSLGSLCFGITVFSYFYLWTATAAWMASILVLTIIIRPVGWRRSLSTTLSLFALCLLWLIPYASLLSNLAHTTDRVQLLVFTHSLDLFHVPEFIGMALLIFVGLMAKRGALIMNDHKTLFIISLALLPIIVNNQQVLTGRQLQSIHFDTYVANYAVVLGLFLAFALILENTSIERRGQVRSTVVIILLGAAAASWGLVECYYTTRFVKGINIRRDQAYAISKFLRESAVDGPCCSGHVFSYDELIADDLPTTARQPVLWAIHQNIFGTIDLPQYKEQYYQYTYFKGYDRNKLTGLLRGYDAGSVATLFGSDRLNSYLTSKFTVLTDAEIEAEANKYENYVAKFDPKNSPATTLSFAILPNNRAIDTSNIDKWYERIEIGTFEQFTLYRLRLRK